MPRDLPDPIPPERQSLRLAVLELLAGGIEDEGQLRTALRQLVAHGRSRTNDLWLSYRGGAPDPLARVFARWAD